MNYPSGDKLILKGLKFYDYHGVLPEEKKLGQFFLADADAWMDLSEGGKSDNISHTVSYTNIFRFRILRPLGDGGYAYVFLVKEIIADGARSALAKKKINRSFSCFRRVAFELGEEVGYAFEV